MCLIEINFLDSILELEIFLRDVLIDLLALVLKDDGIVSDLFLHVGVLFELVFIRKLFEKKSKMCHDRDQILSYFVDFAIVQELR